MHISKLNFFIVRPWSSVHPRTLISSVFLVTLVDGEASCAGCVSCQVACHVLLHGVSGGRGHAIAPAVRLLHSILDLGARASIVLVQHHHFRNQRRLRIKPNFWGMLEVPHERPFRFKTDAHSGTFLPIRAHSDIFATWKCRKTHAAGAHSLQPISPYIILNRFE